jgi:methyl-accepting chemotaxis protein
MKKSILTRLIGGSVLLVVTVALLAVCVAGEARLARAVTDDSHRLARVLENLHLITLRASMLTSEASPALVRSHAAQMAAAGAELLRLTSERTRWVGDGLIYPPDLRETVTTGIARMGVPWQADLSRFLAAAERSLQAPEARDQFLAGIPGFIATGENAVAQVAAVQARLDEARRSLSTSVLALFALFLGVCTLSALAYSLWTLFVLRRDVGTLITFSRRLSDGDVTVFPVVKRSDEIGELAEQFRRMGSLQALVMNLRAAAERLGGEYGKVAERVMLAAGGVKNQARAAEAASRAFAGIAESVRSVEVTAAAGRDASRQGGDAVQASLDRITKGMDATRALEERTVRIEDAVSVIGDVADQTELLSLNAAIEAARAGEAGRGFTVVAQQVRKLADRSARSAVEIGDLVRAVLDGVRKIAADSKESLETGRALQKELERVTAATGSITDLAHSAALGVGKAESSLGAMMGAASDSSRKVDELAASSRSLHEIVGEIGRALERFSTGNQEPESGAAELRSAALPPEPQALPLSLGITPVNGEEPLQLTQDEGAWTEGRKDGEVRDAAGQEEAAQQGAEQQVGGQEAAGQEVAGQEVAGQEVVEELESAEDE